MPCRYDPGPEDYLRTEKQKNEELTAALDKLTHQNDQLREALLNLINDREYVLPAPVVKVISEEQIAHRQEDLARLELHFKSSLSVGKTHADVPGGEHLTLHELLGRVVCADPSRPLKPQLGFDPDDY